MANAEIMVNSERYTFITYWDVERYDNGNRATDSNCCDGA